MYQPLSTVISMTNPEDAVYMENHIPMKDLVAFSAEVEKSNSNSLITEL